jgi:endoglucanase
VLRVRRLPFLFAALVALTAGVLTVAADSAQAVAPPVVRVAGNALVDGLGTPTRLLGVDKSGSEYACVQGWGFFDGPTDDSAIAAMTAWHVNAVRVPLNEDCWLGINGVSATYGGQPYRVAVRDFVARLHAARLIAVLDLHWSAPGDTLATGQQVMADADHSPELWSSVATSFLDDPGVVFDLYNEPHDISWACWRDGCLSPAGWRTAGMQRLVDAVRGTGAKQPIMLAGLNWGGDLSQWTAFAPTDTAAQLVASAHIYNFSACNTTACWDATLAPVASHVPVVTGELGENDCAGGFVDSYMDWADAHGVGYLGWTWNTWDCRSGPALISAADGTPTAFGKALRDHLTSIAAVTPVPAPTPTPTPTPTPSPSVTVTPRVTLVCGFERSACGWRGRTRVVSLSRVSRPHRQGSASLRAVVIAPAWRTTTVALGDSPHTTVTGSKSDVLAAWVFVAARPGATGRRTVVMQMQDAAGRWHSGRARGAVVGRWTRVVIVPGARLWRHHRAIGIRFTIEARSGGTLRAYVDAVQRVRV